MKDEDILETWKGASIVKVKRKGRWTRVKRDALIYTLITCITTPLGAASGSLFSAHLKIHICQASMNRGPHPFEVSVYLIIERS